MRLFYLVNARIPTEKAHGLEAMKLCEALSEYFSVEMIAARRFNPIKDDPFSYYSVKKNFEIKRLPVIDAIALPWLGRLAFWIEATTFSFSCFFYLLFNSKDDDIIFSHENAPLLSASIIRKNTFYDIHDFPVHGLFWYKLLFNRSFGLVTTNNWKKDALIKQFNIFPDKIVVQPNGVEMKEFDININKQEARRKLDLPQDKKIVLYTGFFYGWKGVDTLTAAGAFLDDSYRVYLVGGAPSHIEEFKKRFSEISNLVFIGQRPHQEIPLWLKAADVLVIPNTAKEDISKYFTSPMKLFEYMASKVPIVASDVPSIHEIVNNVMVTFFEPDNAQSLAQVIKNVISQGDESSKKAVAAHQEVQKYSWSARAQKIFDFIQGRTTI